MTISKILGRMLVGIAATFALATPAQAALQARDLNGDTVTDAYFDTDRNITWLRDANVNGRMTWAAANTWAAGYSIGIYDDWRLPTALNADASGPCGPDFNCTGSEMGHLWYTELLNTAGSFTNDGDFLNMQSGSYWSGTEYAPSPNVAWYFITVNGVQTAFSKNFQVNAMAVRPGDVRAAQVPEPESLLLALTGLGALALVRRRRAVGASAL